MYIQPHRPVLFLSYALPLSTWHGSANAQHQDHCVCATCKLCALTLRGALWLYVQCHKLLEANVDTHIIC